MLYIYRCYIYINRYTCAKRSHCSIHPSRKKPWTKVALHFTSDGPKVEKVDPHAGPLGERTMSGRFGDVLVR